MNEAERLLATLNFEHPAGGGTVWETFYPWDTTVRRWLGEGLPERFCPAALFPPGQDYRNRYLDDCMTEGVYAYEKYLGFDGAKWLAFHIPFSCFEGRVLEENARGFIRLDGDGWQRQYNKEGKLVEEIRPTVTNWVDWEALKERTEQELARYCTDENIEQVYGKYREGHEKGEFSIRFRVSGFFWIPRTLMGIEEHLVGYYDEPEMIHDMNRFTLRIYQEYLGKIFEIVRPDMFMLSEDLSGSNGPMISEEMFDEFVGAYYKELFPVLRQRGAKNIFVDTDGDFERLIPRFMEAGVDGFLPMDVNAGMDIVAVRKKYPRLKFIGGFNKLLIAEGKAAIDKEFKRLAPVIRQGGYVPGCDHQAAPSTSYENYLYYIKKLKEAMGRG